MKTIIIISPTKEMKETEKKGREKEISDKTKNIISKIQKIPQQDYQKIYKCSEKIAKETYERFKEIYKSKKSPAIYTYNGISIRHIQAEKMTEEQIKSIDKNLIILSALYGALLPLDNIYKYRLDFKTDIKIDKKNLYKYWEEDINEIFQNFDHVINLASKEYSLLIDRKKVKVTDIEFLKNTNGKLRQQSTSSKILRGEMVRYLAKTKDTSIENIKKFSFENYTLDKNLTDDKKIVFSEK